MTEPAVIRLEPMTPDEFDAWSAHSVQGFAAQQVAAGLLPELEASAQAARAFSELLPAGLATPSHLLWTLRPAADPGTLLGHLWLRVTPSSDEVEAYVVDIELLSQVRGQGLGRAAMRAAEGAARGLDASVLRLNVFGHNTAALRLYDSLGFTRTGSTMTRRLDPSGPPRSQPGRPVGLQDMTGPEYAELRPRLGDLAELLPFGLATSGHRLWTAYDGSDPVAVVWLHLVERSDGLHAQCHWLEVARCRRRQGWGRSVLAVVERYCRELGVRSVRVSLSGSDDGARAWCEESGFDLTAQTMAKGLSARRPRGPRGRPRR